MKKHIIIALLLCLLGTLSSPIVNAQRVKTYKTYKPKTEPVRGYVKKNGTYVAPYMRSRKP